MKNYSFWKSVECGAAGGGLVGAQCGAYISATECRIAPYFICLLGGIVGGGLMGFILFLKNGNKEMDESEESNEESDEKDENLQITIRNSYN